jgi:hypothetical protein
MANSLSFGLMLATVLVLILVPVCYRIFHNWSPDAVGDAEFYNEPLMDQERLLPEDSLPGSTNHTLGTAK